STRLPWFLSSSGFGSNRSTELGAPSMNSQITALVLAGKWVGFGASGPAGAARAASRFRRSASATIPNPAPARRRNTRRSNELPRVAIMGSLPGSVDVDELVQSEQHLTIVSEGQSPDF